MTAYVAGHTGMVGSALARLLGDSAVGAPRRYDLRDPDSAWQAICSVHEGEHPPRAPSAVYLAAARVGGIGANMELPIDFLSDNLQIGLNVVHAAYDAGVERLLNFGSSCIYPRKCTQPMREDDLMSGRLEPTNEGYALAKIAVLKLVDYYRQVHGLRYYSLMPTNLYGPGDRYDMERSHVIPAMIMKFEHAREGGHVAVELWGSGKPLREFLFVDDLARAAVHVCSGYEGEHGWLNVGSGEELSIESLALLIAGATGFRGTIKWNRERPDGTPRKLLDSSKILDLGWRPQVMLLDGLEIAVDDYRRRRKEGLVP